MVLKTSSIGCILCFELEGAEDGFKNDRVFVFVNYYLRINRSGQLYLLLGTKGHILASCQFSAVYHEWLRSCDCFSYDLPYWWISTRGPPL